jgi:hypothetical protein
MSIYLAQDLVNFKRFIAIAEDDVTRDDVFGRVLDSAWTAAERITGQTLNRVLGGVSGTMLHFIGDGSGIYRPAAPYQPLLSCVTLYIDTEAISAATVTTVSSYGHYIEDNAIKLRGYSFSSGVECFAYVTYGLAAASIPEGLRQAVYELAAIRNKGALHLGQKSKTGVSKETDTYFDSDITPAIRDAFETYALRYL